MPYPSAMHAQALPRPGAVPSLRIPAGSEQEHGKVMMEEFSNFTLQLLGCRRGREQGCKASGFPVPLTAWREGCCQFRLLPCWKKVEVTRGPAGRQPGTRN